MEPSAKHQQQKQQQAVRVVHRKKQAAWGSVTPKSKNAPSALPLQRKKSPAGAPNTKANVVVTKSVPTYSGAVFDVNRDVTENQLPVSVIIRKFSDLSAEQQLALLRIHRQQKAESVSLSDFASTMNAETTDEENDFAEPSQGQQNTQQTLQQPQGPLQEPRPQQIHQTANRKAKLSRRKSVLITMTDAEKLKNGLSDDIAFVLPEENQEAASADHSILMAGLSNSSNPAPAQQQQQQSDGRPTALNSVPVVNNDGRNEPQNDSSNTASDTNITAKSHLEVDSLSAHGETQGKNFVEQGDITANAGLSASGAFASSGTIPGNQQSQNVADVSGISAGITFGSEQPSSLGQGENAAAFDANTSSDSTGTIPESRKSAASYSANASGTSNGPVPENQQNRGIAGVSGASASSSTIPGNQQSQNVADVSGISAGITFESEKPIDENTAAFDANTSSDSTGTIPESRKSQNVTGVPGTSASPNTIPEGGQDQSIEGTSAVTFGSEQPSNFGQGENEATFDANTSGTSTGTIPESRKSQGFVGVSGASASPNTIPEGGQDQNIEGTSAVTFGSEQPSNFGQGENAATFDANTPSDTTGTIPESRKSQNVAGVSGASASATFESEKPIDENAAAFSANTSGVSTDAIPEDKQNRGIAGISATSASVTFGSGKHIDDDSANPSANTSGSSSAITENQQNQDLVGTSAVNLGQGNDTSSTSTGIIHEIRKSQDVTGVSGTSANPNTIPEGGQDQSIEGTSAATFGSEQPTNFGQGENAASYSANASGTSNGPVPGNQQDRGIAGVSGASATTGTIPVSRKSQNVAGVSGTSAGPEQSQDVIGTYANVTFGNEKPIDENAATFSVNTSDASSTITESQQSHDLVGTSVPSAGITFGNKQSANFEQGETPATLSENASGTSAAAIPGSQKSKGTEDNVFGTGQPASFVQGTSTSANSGISASTIPEGSQDQSIASITFGSEKSIDDDAANPSAGASASSGVSAGTFPESQQNKDELGTSAVTFENEKPINENETNAGLSVSGASASSGTIPGNQQSQNVADVSGISAGITFGSEQPSSLGQGENAAAFDANTSSDSTGTIPESRKSQGFVGVSGASASPNTIPENQQDQSIEGTSAVTFGSEQSTNFGQSENGTSISIGTVPENQKDQNIEGTSAGITFGSEQPTNFGQGESVASYSANASGTSNGTIPENQKDRGIAGVSGASSGITFESEKPIDENAAAFGANASGTSNGAVPENQQNQNAAYGPFGTSAVTFGREQPSSFGQSENVASYSANASGTSNGAVPENQQNQSVISAFGTSAVTFGSEQPTNFGQGESVASYSANASGTSNGTIPENQQDRGIAGVSGASSGITFESEKPIDVNAAAFDANASGTSNGAVPENQQNQNAAYGPFCTSVTPSSSVDAPGFTSYYEQNSALSNFGNGQNNCPACSIKVTFDKQQDDGVAICSPAGVASGADQNKGGSSGYTWVNGKKPGSRIRAENEKMDATLKGSPNTWISRKFSASSRSGIEIGAFRKTERIGTDLNDVGSSPLAGDASKPSMLACTKDSDNSTAQPSSVSFCGNTNESKVPQIPDSTFSNNTNKQGLTEARIDISISQSNTQPDCGSSSSRFEAGSTSAIPSHNSFDAPQPQQPSAVSAPNRPTSIAGDSPQSNDGNSGDGGVLQSTIVSPPSAPSGCDSCVETDPNCEKESAASFVLSGGNKDDALPSGTGCTAGDTEKYGESILSSSSPCSSSSSSSSSFQEAEADSSLQRSWLRGDVGDKDVSRGNYMDHSADSLAQEHKAGGSWVSAKASAPRNIRRVKKKHHKHHKHHDEKEPASTNAPVNSNASEVSNPVDVAPSNCTPEGTSM